MNAVTTAACFVAEVELAVRASCFAILPTASGVFGITPMNRTVPPRPSSATLMEMVALWTSMPTNDLMIFFMPSSCAHENRWKRL
jgi:hypothetical protein